jgi:hypothetical protein
MVLATPYRGQAHPRFNGKIEKAWFSLQDTIENPVRLAVPVSSYTVKVILMSNLNVLLACYTK